MMSAHELYLLHLGQLGLPDADTGETHFAQVPGCLIRTASGRTVLVDTGNPVAVIGQPTAAPWWDHPNDTRPQDDVVQRLAELGIAPGDVDLLISTHFDFDHCGRHDIFAGSGITSFVQREHLDAARDDPRFDSALWDIPGIAYTPVDGDVKLEPGLRLIASPGHAIGHQSVYVETAAGPVLLAIDAISVAEQITMKRFPSTYPDPEAARRSRDKLVALAAETGAFLLMGHDAQQWATLPKSPAPFRRP
jgi:N-acyl homoserine lactone hydrolase